MYTAVSSSNNSTAQSVSRFSNCHTVNTHQIPPVPLSQAQNAYAEIIEQPASVGVRFRYKCEGRSAGCIRGASSTEKLKTYPTLKVCGYQGVAAVVVSCVTKDGPPYYPHPHNLVGKQTCGNGVCYKQINTPDMICSFPNLGIQCVKKKDIKESLLQRQALQIDPFGTGFSHCSQPGKINLNALRLCFQVFVADSNGRVTIPLPPVVSDPIFDNKTVSDLTITKLSHCSAPAIGGQEIILLCDQVNKDDIQIIFYEERDGSTVWTSQGKFSPHNVHRKAAISFITPGYRSANISHPVEVFIQLRRPSDGAIGKPRNFTYLPLKRDPEGMLRKKQKFEVLRLDRLLYDMPSEPEGMYMERFGVPRTIKQAVRSLTRSNNNHVQSNVENAAELQNQQQSLSNINFQLNENRDLQVDRLSLQNKDNRHITGLADEMQSSVKEIHFKSTQRKNEDILAVAAEQIGINNSYALENMGDNTLEKLNNLDLGFDPYDLDVNVNEMAFDSFPVSYAISNMCSTNDKKS